MDGKNDMGVSVAEGYQELQRGLAQGRRDFPSSHQKVFFDYLKAVAAYEEFGANRGEMVKALEDTEADGLFSSVQTRLPWVTDVFLHGILAGAEARTVAMRELLERYAEMPDALPDARRVIEIDRERLVVRNAGERASDENSVLDSIRRILDAALGCVGAKSKEADCNVLLDDTLSLIRWGLKYLPSVERDRRKDAVLEALGKTKDVSCIPQKERDRIDVFCGKYRTVPVAAGMDCSYSALRSVSVDRERPHECFAWNKILCDEVDFAYRAELERSLRRSMWRCTHGDVVELRRACEVVLDAKDTQAMLRMGGVSADAKERIANGIVGMEILWALAYSASRRLNVHGSGAIRGMHIGGRIARDGRTIEMHKTALYNVDETLDTMVQDAICRMLASRDINGVDVVTHATFREYREGEFDDTYLTAIVDNAIANRKHAVVCPKNGPTITIVSINSGDGEGEDGKGEAPIERMPAPERHDPRDFEWYAFGVVKKYAPKLWDYMRLVEWGISASDLDRMRRNGLEELAEKYSPQDVVQKGDALKIVGAKSAHFVERERMALLKVLEELPGCDQRILAERIKNALSRK